MQSQSSSVNLVRDASDSVVDRFALTPTQQGMLLGTLRHGKQLELHQVVVELEDGVDVLKMRDAWDYAVRRHAVLRSRLRWQQEPVPMHEVMAHVDLPFVIRSSPSLEAFLDEDRQQGLALDRAPAFRLTLLELPQSVSVLVFTHHHVMLDGRSQRLLLEDVLGWYDSNGAAALPPPTPFRRHSEALVRRDVASERAYFTALLQGVEVGSLPRSVSAADASGRGEAALTVSLPGVLPSEHAGPSLASFVQAAWAVLLGAYARSEDVVFGVTRSGRFLVEGAESMLGCLINTVPARVALSSSARALELAESIHAGSRAVRPYEHASLSEIQGWLQLEQPLFDTLIVFERFSLDDALRATSAAATQRRHRVVQQSSFPVVLAAYQREGSLDCFLEFDKERWDASSMQRMLARFGFVLEQMLRSPQSTVSALHLDLPGEMAQSAAWSKGPLVGRLNDDHCDDVLARRAGTQASAPAFVQADGRVHSLADVLGRRDVVRAHLDQLLGISPSVVAVCAQRSIDYLALQLAAFSRGDLFVPLDPEWPAPRQLSVVQVARPRALFVQGEAATPALTKPTGVGGDAWPTLVRIEDLGRLAPQVWSGAAREAPRPDAPAYSIFTSGSTGTPKGVLVSHRSMMAHAQGAQHLYELRPGDRLLQFASPAFDVAIEETMPTLLAGACLVERSESLAADLQAFMSDMTQRGVTVLNLPSGFFHLLMLHLQERGARLPSSLRLLIVGSEKPTLWSLRVMHQLHPGVRLINAYGPTEATISCTACDVSQWLADGSRGHDLPIGRPWGGSEVWLLDRHARPCPVDLPGEICIAGPQVALGYLNAPDVQAARFVPSPVDGQRMYRSGDLGRLRDDGQIEFLGRVDEQVKVRGVRVELGEVEQALRAVEGVSDAAVVVRHSGRGNEMVAYAVRRAGTAIGEAAVKSSLADALPSAFVPSEVRFIDDFPRHANGKLDRRALARMAQNMVVTQRALAMPKGDVEIFVLGVFAKLLERDDIDVNDSFFEIGGHSLLAVQLLGEINRITNPPIALTAIFSAPSVRALAEHLGQRESVRLPSVVPLNARAQELMKARRLGQVEAPGPAPVFFVCGVNLYAQLARAMNVDRPVFGVVLELEEQVASGQWTQLDTRQMARAYLEVLRHEWPKGPYILGGVSFGGILAYEMAQQLKQEGEATQLLVLLDSILPRAFRAIGFFARLRQNVRRVVEGATGLAPRELARENVRRLLTRMGLRARKRIAIDAVAARDRMYRYAAEQYDHIVQAYDGNALLVRARRSLDDERETIDWDQGWSGLLPHETPFFGVDGDHLGILADPGASEIARIIRQRLTAS